MKFWLSLLIMEATVLATAAHGLERAISTGEHERLNHWGAMISGLGALFVFFQYSYDVAVEQIEKTIAEGSITESAFLGPIRQRIRNGFREARNSRTLLKLERRKKIFVAFIAINVFFGETVHGFGGQILEHFH